MRFRVYINQRSVNMAYNITTPWKIHLRGSGHSTGRRWWTRRKYHDDPGARRPVLMKEQDLDHLGAVHDRTVHPRKQG